ncbi:MAG: DUF3299 domain-containing protein [Pseudomonadota bacterium]
MMIRTIQNIAFAALLGVGITTVALAPAFAAQTIEWRTLLPKLKPLVDPLSAMTEDQRFEFETIAWARTLVGEERDLEHNKQTIEDARAFTEQFARDGINVETLIQNYMQYQLAAKKRQSKLNTSLDGKTIKIPGYLLPLEFSPDGEREFLLVPYVGACIHVPPPPPNQMVSVMLRKKFKVADMFTAVWLTGELKATPVRKRLTLGDGSRFVPVGYRLVNGTIKVIPMQQ